MDTHKNAPCAVNEISNLNEVCNKQHSLPCRFSFYTYKKSTYSPHRGNTNVLVKPANAFGLYSELTLLLYLYPVMFHHEDDGGS